MSESGLFDDYLKELHAVARQGDAREESFYPALADMLKDLPCLSPDRITNSGTAYIVSKKANHLQVQYAAAHEWGERGARINTISPGVIVTPLAYDEFNANVAGYQRMIDATPMRSSR
ncbi:MAG: short chain dehydrogenase [Firmicutes bacterium ADurb.BinA205]|nr:MAG: short chain dehydrogenase [Firmicutes bacterium ADurb.BinA205]